MTKIDDPVENLMQRANELKEGSLDFGHAFSRAHLEQLINL